MFHLFKIKLNFVVFTWFECTAKRDKDEEEIANMRVKMIMMKIF